VLVSRIALYLGSPPPKKLPAGDTETVRIVSSVDSFGVMGPGGAG
jgi:hypothetical protein